MEFKKFAEMYLNLDKDNMRELSQYKHENEKQYAEYRERVLETERFYNRNRERSLRDGCTLAPLTIDNYFQYEHGKDAMNKLMSR